VAPKFKGRRLQEDSDIFGTSRSKPVNLYTDIKLPPIIRSLQRAA
jgi:hypothetical protein